MPDSAGRVCVLGNSHARAVTHAIKSNQDHYPRVTCHDHFHLWREKPDDPHSIIIHRVGGLGDFVISLNDADLYIVFAGGWWAARNDHLLGRVVSHPLAHVTCPSWQPVAANPPTPPSLVSQAVFDEMVYLWISGHQITTLVRFICKANKRVVWVPWPAPDRSLKTSKDWALNALYGENAPRVWLDFFKAQYAALRRLTEEIGDNLSLLPYPPAADALEDGFMDSALCDQDPFHGNIGYGLLVLSQLEPLLRPNRPA
jgi:hypothetical protein